jgi:hypothetical protein
MSIYASLPPIRAFAYVDSASRPERGERRTTTISLATVPRHITRTAVIRMRVSEDIGGGFTQDTSCILDRRAARELLDQLIAVLDDAVDPGGNRLAPLARR